MTQERCTHEFNEIRCRRGTYEEQKCIFHCGKSDWFTTDANGIQDWSKSGRDVKAFWIAFGEEWIDKKTSDFSFFVFPIFTNDVHFLIKS